MRDEGEFGGEERKGEGEMEERRRHERSCPLQIQRFRDSKKNTAEEDEEVREVRHKHARTVNTHTHTHALERETRYTHTHTRVQRHTERRTVHT